MSENCNHNCEGCQADCGSRKADFKQSANKYSHIKKVIGVVSGKGGVGKSLVTCLLAAGCAKAGLKVDRKSTRLNSSHLEQSRMPSSA